MAKEFSAKDAKALIKNIKSIEKELIDASNYQNNKTKEIVSAFSPLYSNNVFSNLAKDYFLDKTDEISSEQFKNLIKLLKQFLDSNGLVSHSNELIKQMEKEVDEDISSLSPAANNLKWLFTSKKKKQAAIDSYNKVLDYSNSYVINDARITIDSTNGLNLLDTDEAFSNFLSNKNQYKNVIKHIINTKDNKPILDVIMKLFTDCDSINAKVINIESSVNQDKDDIRAAIQRMIANELYKTLEAIPIEEINHDKKGIRVKPLREAGYTNMADVYTASAYHLSSVYGVSQDNAYTIKRIAEGYADKARDGIKIKISYDDQNKIATIVVKTIYIYRQKQKFINQIKAIKEKYNHSINSYRETLNEVGSGRFWAFLSDNEKREVKSSYDNLKEIIEGEYGAKISEIFTEYKGLSVDSSTDNAWNDFRENSIGFYNVIDEICPGVLESIDSKYGLPEELAKEIQDECFFPDGLLCTLRRYQEWGVKYILHQERVLLGDEMGLGKTVQAIASMVSLKNTGATHFAVVCPASVVTNWCREIQKHSRLKVMKAHGSAKASVVKAWIKNGGVVVTTYESTSAFKLDPMFRFSELIVDEAHYIKNKGAARSARTIELSKHADRLLFMTGTALENKVDEMISLISVLNPDIAESVSRIAFMSSAPQFRKEVAPVYYRRKREDVLTELPDLIESEEWCTMGSEETISYEEAVLSKQYMQARRLSWNVPNLDNSSKMNRLLEIIEDAKNDDRKILIFSYFLDTIQKIYDKLGSKICMNPINGSVNPNRRQEIIDEFEKAPAGTVLCAQIQSGGTGLNIQAASVVVICEPQLKPSIENQAISRAYRMGQSRNVQVFRLLCEDTIDERILNKLKEKQAIFDAFADKSVAAQNVEIDDNTLGDIIKEEIERIKKKKGELPEEPIKPVEKWEKAKDTYKGLPMSVTKRIKMVAQPDGGYISPAFMKAEYYDSENHLYEKENVHASVVGIAVDYLTRFMIDKDAEKAFNISFMGASVLHMEDKACELLKGIKGLDDDSITAALKLSGFDSAFRAGIKAYSPIENINPDEHTIENVREMVNRSLKFWEKKGPVIWSEFTFKGGYTRVIDSGDGDFMTNDTLWDFKVSKNEPTNLHTFQLLVYYVMGLHSIHPQYKKIKYLGIFNPRLNRAYTFDVSKLDEESIKRVEEEVIGY